jgi:hypothetical protein
MNTSVFQQPLETEFTLHFVDSTEMKTTLSHKKWDGAKNRLDELKQSIEQETGTPSSCIQLLDSETAEPVKHVELSKCPAKMAFMVIVTPPPERQVYKLYANGIDGRPYYFAIELSVPNNGEKIAFNWVHYLKRSRETITDEVDLTVEWENQQASENALSLVAYSEEYAKDRDDYYLGIVFSLHDESFEINFLYSAVDDTWRLLSLYTGERMDRKVLREAELYNVERFAADDPHLGYVVKQ